MTGGIIRLGPANPMGDARLENIGSVRILMSPLLIRYVACPIQIA